MSTYPSRPIGFVRGSRGGKLRAAKIAYYEYAPAPGTNTAILPATTLADGIETVIQGEAITKPDVPRCLLIKGNAASVAGTVTLVGLDSNGRRISETLTANGATAVPGSKAFAHVISITLPPRSASGNTISVGTRDVLGLWHTLAFDSRLFTQFDGSADAGTLAIDATDVCKNLFTPAGTLDGSKVLRIVYLVG